jgi:hypothetical protein
MIVEPEPVEQRALRYLPTHHVPTPRRSAGVNHGTRPVASTRFSTVSTGFLAINDFASSVPVSDWKTRCGNHWHIAGCRMSFLAG